MTTNGTELAVREYDMTDLAPRFVISMDDLRSQVRQLEEFKRDIMVDGVDYGVIPGTPKPTLLKPGAEKLSMVFGLAPTFESANTIEDWERGFFHYDERCVLTSKRSGQVAASANGSANSKEPRYRWRKSERACPMCGKAAIIKGKQEYGGGWICFDKKGGCKAKFRDDDPAITTQAVGNIENPEPYELVNTIKKMAQKRALVAAVLIATGGSGIWTQDIEDMPSVAGPDDDNIIDIPSQPAQRRSPMPEMVHIEDDRFREWLKLCDEASNASIEYVNLVTPVELATLRLEYGKLRKAINAKKAQQSADSPLPTESAPSSRVSEGQPAADTRDSEYTDALVTDKNHPLWKRWLSAEAEARKANLGIDTSGVKLGKVTEIALDASCADLESMVAEKTSDEPAF